MASQLTAIATDAAKSRNLTGAWDGPALLKIFGEIETFDRAIEKRRDLGGKLFWGGITGLILLILPVLKALGESYEVLILSCVPFTLAGVVAWQGNRMKKQAVAADLANELYLTILPLLRRLIGDLDPKQKIRVRLDLRGVDLNTPDLSIPGANRKSIGLYSEPLGSLRLALANGDTLVLRIRNRYKRSFRKHPRKSAKDKEKWKKSTKVTAILIPDKPLRAIVPDAKQAPIHFDNTRGTLRLDRQVRFATGVRRATGVPPQETIPVADVMSMLVRLSSVARHRG